jgi:hypothetical protein
VRGGAQNTYCIQGRIGPKGGNQLRLALSRPISSRHPAPQPKCLFRVKSAAARSSAAREYRTQTGLMGAGSRPFQNGDMAACLLGSYEIMR